MHTYTHTHIHTSGNVVWPASVETEWDGKPHSCFPRQHSCVMPLYRYSLYLRYYCKSTNTFVILTPGHATTLLCVCVMPLYSMRLVRQAADYSPQDRYQNQPQSEPTESPANMDLELALFTGAGVC